MLCTLLSWICFADWTTSQQCRLIVWFGLPKQAPPLAFPSLGETSAPPSMLRPRGMPCWNQSTCSRFRSCQGQMTHFSMGEREGPNVRKQGRQQERQSAANERKRTRQIHVKRRMHANTHIHRAERTGKISTRGSEQRNDFNWKKIKLDLLLIHKHTCMNHNSINSTATLVITAATTEWGAENLSPHPTVVHHHSVTLRC